MPPDCRGRIEPRLKVRKGALSALRSWAWIGDLLWQVLWHESLG